MRFQTTIKPEEFELEDLLEFFRLFCWAHEIRQTKDPLKKFKIRSNLLFKELMENGDLEYNINAGAKFHVGKYHYSPEKIALISSGYCEFREKCPKHEKRFQNALKEYSRQLRLF